MAGNITSAELNDSIATIIAAEALGYLQANTVLAQLVSRDWDDEIAQAGQVIRIPFTGALSANDKAEGSVVTLQNAADTKVDVTLNKHKEVSFLIEDFGRKPLHTEGKPDSGWVLLDYGDVILHVFSTTQRTFYNLEQLWAAATPIVRLQ